MVDITQHVTDRVVGSPSHVQTERLLPLTASADGSRYFRAAYFSAGYFAARYFRGPDADAHPVPVDRVTGVTALVWS